MDSQGWTAYEADRFYKSDGKRTAWYSPAPTELETASELLIAVGDSIVKINQGTPIELPTLLSGTDYVIYALANGALEAVDADSSAPTNARKVGGFHARASDGNINTNSCWDLNFRPRSNPRGMALSLDGQTWVDIYLCDVSYSLRGYSKNLETIADIDNPLLVPARYGGNGVDIYSSGSWWSFNDVFSASDKRMPYYNEFVAYAAGTVQFQSTGVDPVITKHQPGHTSSCGIEQATGVMWQWGADITGSNATGAADWQNWTEGRGDVFTNTLTAPLFGGEWASGVHSGSRASGWFQRPEQEGVQIGARAVCGHINLQGGW
tara:strand:+ start:1174 stop:2136 length:963 start_codon:yes stop_codon:yes gene_type:complete